jgi:hypothetical protein
MRNFFKPIPAVALSQGTECSHGTDIGFDEGTGNSGVGQSLPGHFEWIMSPAKLARYSSDEDLDDGDEADDEEEAEDPPVAQAIQFPSPSQSAAHSSERIKSSHRLPGAPPLKRVRHEIPVRKQREKRLEQKFKTYQAALDAIHKLLDSKKTKFAGGHNGLQAHRTRAIESFLHMMVKGGHNETDASERAAECHGFAPRWGGRNVRSWAKA